MTRKQRILFLFLTLFLLLMRIPGHSATRFRLKAPPDSVSFRHPNPVEAAT